MGQIYGGALSESAGAGEGNDDGGRFGQQRLFYGKLSARRTADLFGPDGGTDFETAVNAFTRRVENKIIFTDGYADMPSKRLDAIWVVFGGKEINPNGGKVIQISDEQLEKLYYQTVNTSFKK